MYAQTGVNEVPCLLQDCEVTLQGCTVRGNGAGSIQYLGSTDVSLEALRTVNSVKPEPVKAR